jgi:hypothetical protein
MTKWEYKVYLNPEPSDLNILGERGWELVAVTVDRSRNRVAYLKKEALSKKS